MHVSKGKGRVMSALTKDDVKKLKSENANLRNSVNGLLKSADEKISKLERERDEWKDKAEHYVDFHHEVAWERDNLKQQLKTVYDVADSLNRQVNELRAVIDSHNEDCVSLCGDKSACGYKQYDRQCPNCAKDWMIAV